MSDVASHTVGHVSELLTPTLQQIIHRLDPRTRLICSYHFGWCDEHGQPTKANPGKGIRPALALLSAEACGADPRIALPGAAAVELVHNFSLVHDDVMDRDRRRRHRASVWAIWGEAAAILAGDAMLALAHEALAESTSPHRGVAHTTIATAIRELVAGQAADIAFERRGDVSLAECFTMSWHKTAALLVASAVAGAQLAGAALPVRAALSAYGGELGLAFQLVDDLLGIWGRSEVTGKPVYSDLRSRKKTLPLTWTLHHGGSAGRELAAWLAHPAHTDTHDELRDVATLIERGGGRAWAHQEARTRAARAIEALGRADIPEAPRCELAALAHQLIDRNA